jgi:peptide/nickel transport system permease protein
MAITTEPRPLAGVQSDLNHVARPRTQWSLTWNQLKRSWNARIGGVVAIVLVAVALVSAWITPYDPIATRPKDRLQGPSMTHLMGTDKLGRDIFSRVIAGTPNSLKMGLIAVAIGAVAGTLLGLIAGYYQGPVSVGILMLADAMLAFPSILLALSIVAALGPGLTNTMIAVGVSFVPGFIRLVRASVLSTKENAYIAAARVIGARDGRIIVRHVLPNVLAPIIVLCTLGLAGAILIGASLSFLGLGAQPPTPEWGATLNDGRSLLRLAPWIATFPGIAIMITVLAMNLLGDGLRDALDPRMKV